MTILAKPTGITLSQHSSDVEAEATLLASAHPFVIEKYKKFVGKDFKKRVEIAGKYHDIGKKDKRWQSACQKDYELFLKGEKYGHNLKKVKMRHEIASLVLTKNKNFSEPVQVAIAAHHQRLSFKHEKRWSDKEVKGAQEFWDKFVKISQDAFPILDGRKFEMAIRKHYEYAGVRAYTQLADHRASIKENHEYEFQFVPDIVQFYYEFPYNSKRPVQELAEKYADEPLLLLRAPTGAGKTDAALLWAKKQIDAKRADRLVIAMPTRFTSNALAINLCSRVTETGLYHSSAWYVRHSEKASQNKENEHKERLIHEFARLLESPVTVCTIDHLLASLTLSREDHHAIMFNFAHSCLVIDEADFYDDFTQANIQKLLIAARVLEVPVMVMSASLPDISLKIYNDAGYQNVVIREDKSDLERPRCRINSISEYTEIEQIAELLENCKSRTTIIYANTISKATEIKRWCSKREISAVLYHSRFIEKDKKKKEDILLEMLGLEAWKKQSAKGIAILTQIGEISVNISADFMISEICPIDRLVQRIGRLSRFSQNIGQLDILIPMKNGFLYPAPYGSFSRNTGWKPNVALEQTIKLLSEKTYSASDFVNLVNKVYSDAFKFSNEAIINARKLEESFVSNWLILPAEEMEEDKEETKSWKSRDIDPQVTVFVEIPETYFKNYMEFQEFKNEYGVPVQAYLVDQGLKKGSLSHYQIGVRDEERTVIVANPAAYSFEEGLQIDYNFENQSC
jgi:CRISPR-associated endonuclease/helicase Cas3